MNQPEKEYGWITALTPVEIKALKPFSAGDAHWDRIEEKWCEHFNCLVSGCNYRAYRRRINPGPGCEIVPKEERPKEGDEETYDGINWNQVPFNYANTVEWHFKNPPPALAFRRKLPVAQPAASAQPAPWIKFSERRPTQSDLPIEVVFINKEGKWINRWNTCVPSFDGNTTHWRKADNTFPVPAKPASQLAFEKLFGPIEEREGEWRGWVAAVEWKGDGK